MESLDDALDRQHGVVARSTAIRHLGESAVRWRLHSGRWQRPFPAVLVTHSGPLDEQQRLWTDLVSAGTGAVLAGLTAARLDGLNGYEPQQTYVLIPPGRQVRRRPDLTIHRSKFLGKDDIHPVRLPPRTRLPRSLIDAASWMPTDNQARTVVTAGVQQRLVRVNDLLAVLNRLPNVRRRRVLRQTLGDVAGGSESLPEIDFVGLLDRYGLPRPTRQSVRIDRQGRRRWLDACFEEWNLVVEIDGLWHMEARSWWADMARDNDLVIQGDRVLRYPSFAIREQQRLVAEQIRAALRASGWHG